MKRILTVLALSLSIGACDSGGGSAQPEKTPPPTKTAKPKGSTKPAAAAPAGPSKPLAKELTDPSLAKEKAPDKFRVTFTTTKGDFVVEVVREWAPHGADRFYNLVKIGFLKDIALFRVVQNFVVQFGIHGHPEVAAVWREAKLKDEPVKQSNKQWYLTYAKGGPNSRTTQMFINYKDNDKLDKMGFPAFGKVIEGTEVVAKFYSEYGERPSRHQQNIQQKGNRWLKKMFPELDYIKTATIVK